MNDANATKGTQTWDNTKKDWNSCVATECKTGYNLSGGKCTEIFYEITVEVRSDIKDFFTAKNTKFKCSAAKDTDIEKLDSYVTQVDDLPEELKSSCIRACYDTAAFAPKDNTDQYCNKIPEDKCNKDVKIYIGVDEHCLS